MVFRLHEGITPEGSPKAIPKRDTSNTPEITQELLDYLNIKFPNALPTGKQATLEGLHMRIGWRRVVDHLEFLRQQQERSDIPEEHVHT